MRIFVFISSLLFLLSCLSCTDQQENSVSPLAPEAISSSNGYSEVCQSNLITIANAVELFFGDNGSYPINMEDLGTPFSELTCPECGDQYLLESDAANYQVSCPSLTSTPHGFILNSITSWAPDAQWICRSNMRTIASQNMIFFACNERYAENLEELGMADYVCPDCGDQYCYYPYGEASFFLGCSLPSGLNHGYIDDGVASWPPGGNPQKSCRANMRTIASQNVIFFACNERYAKNLEELDMGGVVCPECGDEYILEGDDTSFYLECGLGSDPNHGRIDNGVASW